jgi:hypothetical protein
LKEQILDQGS